MKRIAIIGASGHGKVIADIAKATGYSDVEFFDDAWPNTQQLDDYLVVGNTQSLYQQVDKYDAVIVAIGNASIRRKIQQTISKQSPPLIHPAAIIGNNVAIGYGSVVMPGVIINAGTTIGKSSIINSGAIVEHDCVIGDYSHICPGTAIAGGCAIGDNTWVGIGSSVIQLIKIGDNVMVGAGSVVIRDIESGDKVAGNPAKSI